MVRREHGSALVVALVAITLATLAAMAVGGLIQSRAIALRLDERDVRLFALSDAAMAETLARLAQDRDFPGIEEQPLGSGWIASRVERHHSTMATLTVEGRIPEWRAVIEAEVRLSARPLVVSWSRRTGAYVED